MDPIGMWYLEKQGESQEALRIYSEISGDSDSNSKIRENARYNMGTIYLKEGARHWNEKGVWAHSKVVARLGWQNNATGTYSL